MIFVLDRHISTSELYAFVNDHLPSPLRCNLPPQAGHPTEESPGSSTASSDDPLAEETTEELPGPEDYPFSIVFVNKDSMTCDMTGRPSRHGTCLDDRQLSVHAWCRLSLRVAPSPIPLPATCFPSPLQDRTHAQSRLCVLCATLFLMLATFLSFTASEAQVVVAPHYPPPWHHPAALPCPHPAPAHATPWVAPPPPVLHPASRGCTGSCWASNGTPRRMTGCSSPWLTMKV